MSNETPAKASGSAPDEIRNEDFPREVRAHVEVLRAFCAPHEAAWRSLCKVMRALATPPASAPEVTESMLDRARKAIVCNGESVEWEITRAYKYLIPEAQESMVREVLRTALTAALQEGKSHG